MNPKRAEGLDKAGYQQDLILLGKQLIYRKWGFCYPHRIELIKEEKVVYRWDKEEYRRDKENQTRREYFFGRKKRTYEGDQFCFCEYCGIALRKKRVPTDRDIKNKLEHSVAEMYEHYLRRIVLDKS